MMALGARIRAYATTSGMAPLAMVASTSDNFEHAQLFAVLAETRRPIKIFRELHEARHWLDAETPAN